eukprot:CAMPEP_0198287762 /NCGR_PEP_ID=MMETSP1449-20131203/6468_1 /TAXON_ID=420275 /ORGANISM="Attheya septentrionalis, Strain CCMP2084" /LENGTH=447 /DNA_ID=CAMNT_0043985775 /DNA_START=223 /DNA_END=1563 /DNA_ORIENTATION=-
MPRLHVSSTTRPMNVSTTSSAAATSEVSYDDCESPQLTSAKRVATISQATEARPPLPPPPTTIGLLGLPEQQASPSMNSHEGLTRRRIMQRPPPPPPPLRTSYPNNPSSWSAHQKNAAANNNRSINNNHPTHPPNHHHPNNSHHDWSWWMAMVVLCGVVGWVVWDCSSLGILPFWMNHGRTSEEELIQRVQEVQEGLAQRAAHVDSRATRMRQEVKGLHEDASDSLVELAHGYGIQFDQHVRKFRTMMESSDQLKHELWNLQHTVQIESERHIQAHFGIPPHHVELQIEGHFPLQITLNSHHMPHASHLFLNQVHHRLWDNMTLERHSSHDLYLFQAHLSPETQETFRDMDVSGIAFDEPDPDSEEHHDEESSSDHKTHYCVGFVYPENQNENDETMGKKPVYPLYIQKRNHPGATPGPCFAHVVSLEDVDDLFSHTTLQLERAKLF